MISHKTIKRVAVVRTRTRDSPRLMLFYRQIIFDTGIEVVF